MTSYLVLPDLPTAFARSQAQAAALKCDGVHTKYWWSVTPLTDGTAAVIVEDAGPFAVSTATTKAVAGLAALEVTALKPASAVAALLPVAVAVQGTLG